MDEIGELFEQNVSLKLDRLHFELLYKRLEKHRFQWPETEKGVLDIHGRELAWLLDGLTLDQRDAHQQLSYTSVI